MAGVLLCEAKRPVTDAGEAPGYSVSSSAEPLVTPFEILPFEKLSSGDLDNEYEDNVNPCV